MSVQQKESPRMASCVSFREWFVSLLIFYLSTLSICSVNRWQKLIHARSIRLRDMGTELYLSRPVSIYIYIYIYQFTRLHLTRYPLSRLLSSSRLNTSNTNLILGIFAIHMNILCRKFIEFIPTSENIWGINHRESTKSCVFQYNQKRVPEWRSMALAVSYKKRIISQNISYSRYCSHIPGYQVVKFDYAGFFYVKTYRASTISKSAGFSECILFRYCDFTKYQFSWFLTTHRLRFPI